MGNNSTIAAIDTNLIHIAQRPTMTAIADKKYYVSVTGLKLSSFLHLPKFWYYNMPTMRQAQNAKGNISVDGNCRWASSHPIGLGGQTSDDSVLPIGRSRTGDENDRLRCRKHQDLRVRDGPNPDVGGSAEHLERKGTDDSL